jgi:hypothetical protein
VTVGKHVHLDRTFSPLHASDKDAEDHEITAFVGGRKPINWAVVENSHRVVILAGAGIGKTHEMRRRAEGKLEAGKAAFFIRIEDICDDFELSFEIGDDEAFQVWLSSSEEAWFYLDSIDESRLDDPRKFEKAIRRFARKVKAAQHRAHILISSRPYAWRSHTDHVMVQKHLPYSRQLAKVVEGVGTEKLLERVSEQIEDTSETKGGLLVYVLNDLTETDIRIFAEARGVADSDLLVEDIQRRNLFAVAARPFDLESIIEKWKQDGDLGSRLDFLRFGIDKRLSEINPDRDRQQPLNRERARAGARRLAAAVVLSGKSGIRVPDERPLQDGVDAAAVLGDWRPDDVHALLERGIFDDVIYGKVRFRHREVRELLAAEWLAELLGASNSRRAIESLIFREKYGHTFIAPRLRPMLPWLILLDEIIRRKAFALSPEIIAEGGDPSRLPLDERRKRLDEIVARIAGDVGPRSASDNDAIARIAEPDLSDDVLRLINEHRENDSALFFLGRLVWQGKMTACVRPMAEIAVNGVRGRYARIAAVRAVATAGTREDLDAVWDSIVADENPVDRHLAAEIVSNASSDCASINRFLAMIERLTPYERYQTTGLSDALHRFLDGFDVEQVDDQQELARLIEALNEVLSRGPHLDGGGEQISRDQSWLLSVAAHAVERLVGLRSPHALKEGAIAILHKMSSAHFWHDVDLGEHAKRLQEAVPDWSDMNDTVFWSAISVERARREETDGARLTDPFRALNHDYCHYGGADFDRVLAFIRNRKHDDDKLVAVTLAFRLLKKFNLPDNALRVLRSQVEDTPQLAEHLEGLVNWQPTKEQLALDAKFERGRQKRERRKSVASEHRRRWIARLQADPSLVARPDTIEPGQMSNFQAALMEATSEGRGTQWSGKDWRSLIPIFGEDVSAAYREAASRHWRNYSPDLASDGIDTFGVPQTLIFGLAGLEIEAEQVDEFPANLSDDELRLAMRYAPRELNGFPTWLQRAFRHRSSIVTNALLHELAWDLAREDAPRSYMLHDIVYHAPWLHVHIADWIIAWLEANSVRNAEVLRQAIFIAKSTTDSDRLSALARTKLELQAPIPEQAKWFALWVDIDADEAIPCLEGWLGSLPVAEATGAAQHFITELIGSRRTENLGTGFDSHRTPAHLKRLYVLMYQHIRADEDIERAGGGVYSPGLRDDAQEARNGLFNALYDIPGKETYIALRELAEDHPNISARAWMLRLACERAEKDGDIEDWSDDQLREFDTDQSMSPATNAQLFLIAVQRLIDIQLWLEDGDDSPYKTWQRVEAEPEMRNLIAGRLNDLANGRYACSQENEMPNAQRPDIWVQRPGLTSVPIELKLLDNGWTGPSLCERLRNQLAGDYLRDEGGGRGVLLLVWQGREPDRRWQIGDRLVDLADLDDALQEYWASIAHEWPAVEEVKIIVIDLSRRGHRSIT